MPNYQHLHYFGCLCFPWLRPYTSRKLLPKSTTCVFIGYSLTQHAYLCLDPTTQRIYSSHHIGFVENKYPFASKSSPSNHNSDTLADWCSLMLPVPQNTNSPNTHTTLKSYLKIFSNP